MTIQNRWQTLCNRKEWTDPTAAECWVELANHYGETGRFYHTLEHIDTCLNELEAGEDSKAIELALWFHDVIYDPKRSDNESASARWAGQWLARLGEPPELISRVERLVLVTDHNTPPETGEEKRIVDIDLAILGSDPDTYKTYSAKVREEYAFVPENEYRAGRAKVLTTFLSREKIYQTAPFAERFETRARQNLEREIATLRGTD